MLAALKGSKTQFNCFHKAIIPSFVFMIYYL